MSIMIIGEGGGGAELVISVHGSCDNSMLLYTPENMLYQTTCSVLITVEPKINYCVHNLVFDLCSHIINFSVQGKWWPGSFI